MLMLLKSADSPQTQADRRRNDNLIIELREMLKAAEEAPPVTHDRKRLRSKSRKQKGRTNQQPNWVSEQKSWSNEDERNESILK